jgi:hypothetical protein
LDTKRYHDSYGNAIEPIDTNKETGEIQARPGKARMQMITPLLALRGYLAVMILLVLMAGLAIAQTPKAAGTVKKWTPPRTSWGDPDLQGIWNNSTITPLERPEELRGKEFLTEDEASELEKRAVQSRVDRPPPKGDPGSYNQFWFEWGNKVVPTKRTSLIVIRRTEVFLHCRWTRSSLPTKPQAAVSPSEPIRNRVRVRVSLKRGSATIRQPFFL